MHTVFTRGILRSKSERSSPTRRSNKHKKNVRFVDSVDLEQAQFRCDTCDNIEPVSCQVYNPPPQLELHKQFWLPTGEEVRWLVATQCVHLESVRSFGRAVTGVIRVANVNYEKKIQVRFTYDQWTTSHVTQGSYSGSPCSSQDQFSFCIFLPFLRLDMHVHFCIRFESGGNVFWDSNGGANYQFVCRTATLRNPFFLTDCSILF